MKHGPASQAIMSYSLWICWVLSLELYITGGCLLYPFPQNWLNVNVGHVISHLFTTPLTPILSMVNTLICSYNASWRHEFVILVFTWVLKMWTLVYPFESLGIYVGITITIIIPLKWGLVVIYTVEIMRCMFCSFFMLIHNAVTFVNWSGIKFVILN